MRRGATVSFWPDTTVLTATTFDYDTIVEHLRVLCYLNPGLTVQTIDARPETPDACAFHFPSGVRAYVHALNRDRRILHKPIGISAYSGQPGLTLPSSTIAAPTRPSCPTSTIIARSMAGLTLPVFMPRSVAS